MLFGKKEIITRELDHVCKSGIRLHYLKTEDGKPPLVLIHGQSM